MTTIETDPQDPKSVKVGSVHWRLWESDSGTPYATRAGHLTEEQMLAGCEMTIPANSQEELHRLLLAQPDPADVEDFDS